MFYQFKLIVFVLVVPELLLHMWRVTRTDCRVCTVVAVVPAELRLNENFKKRIQISSIVCLSLDTRGVCLGVVNAQDPPFPIGFVVGFRRRRVLGKNFWNEDFGSREGCNVFHVAWGCTFRAGRTKCTGVRTNRPVCRRTRSDPTVCVVTVGGRSRRAAP